jgi:RsiW-degrading membrane proteinase PrsW (M82 family)
MNIQLDFITGVSIFLAALPALIWAFIFFSDKRDKFKGLYFKVFLGGTLTVLPIIGMQLGYMNIIGKYPNLDFVFKIKDIIGPAWWIVILYSFVSITEEIVKFYIIRFSDKNHPELITNINQSLKFGILSALGFAFSENILYFSMIWKNFGSEALIAPLLFRSTFTVCAHLCFTGIFAYLYGMSKFSKDFVDFKKWQGEPVAINEYQRIRNKYVFTGLSLSVILHTLFNTTLELGERLGPLKIGNLDFNIFVVLVVLLVAGMFIYLQHLLSRKTGNLTFILADKHHSTMAQKDEEVVLELIGMWYKEGRYQEVEEICTRLLKRDPDNNVVKLFRAKTQEKLYQDEE